MKKQITIWEEELNCLLKENTNFKRQLELAQDIYRESKILDKNLTKKINLEGNDIRLNNLTPRFFKKKNLSASILLQSEKNPHFITDIEKTFLNKDQLESPSYTANLTQPTEITRIIPQNFCLSVILQPHMQNGSSKIILHKNKNDYLFEEYDKFFLRSKSFPEASVMFLAGHQEQQVMTRFMYPNPKFEDLQL